MGAALIRADRRAHGWVDTMKLTGVLRELSTVSRPGPQWNRKIFLYRAGLGTT